MDEEELHEIIKTANIEGEKAAEFKRDEKVIFKNRLRKMTHNNRDVIELLFDKLERIEGLVVHLHERQSQSDGGYRSF